MSYYKVLSNIDYFLRIDENYKKELSANENETINPKKYLK